MNKENQYLQCPYCKSGNISGYECDFDGNVCNNKVECNDCEKQWEECYELTARFTLPDADGNTKRIDTFKTYSDKEWSHI